MPSHKYSKDGRPYVSTQIHGSYHPQPIRDKPFKGVDGEGGNLPDPDALFGTRHQYLLLRAGKKVLFKNNEPLTYRDCFEFLSHLDTSFCYVSYFFDYDVTMMVRTMRKERAKRLLYRSLRYQSDINFFLPLDVDGQWEIDYLPHKEFKIRWIKEDAKGPWVTINDTGQFFQSGFLATLEKWDIGTPEQRALIARGKAARSGYSLVTQEEADYNALECSLEEQLMEQFRRVCYQVGYVPRRWQGPGNIASAMFNKHKIPRRRDIPIMRNRNFLVRANAAYYGGRFETTIVGPFPYTVYQYDINGAYVALLRDLPCLKHAEWQQVKSRPDCDIYFGEVHFNHDGYRYLYHLPFRLPNGNIRFPKEGNGTYWSWELEAAEKAGAIIDFKSGWAMESYCDCTPFSFVDELYRQRIALGKSAKGYVLKLGGNSLYGKIAQSVGEGPYANPVWAGLITAGCRTMLINAYSQLNEHHGSGKPPPCLMLATDGLFMSEPLELPISNKLGEWEESIYDDIFIAQPGCYFTSEGTVKTRGIEHGKMAEMRTDFERAFDRFISEKLPKPYVEVPVDNFISAKMALHQNRWEKAGSWVSKPRKVSFVLESKRMQGTRLKNSGVYTTLPYLGSPDDYSEPYPKIIGGGQNNRLAAAQSYDNMSELILRTEEVKDQPDWVEPIPWQSQDR